MKDYLFIQDKSLPMISSHFASLTHMRDLWICGFEEVCYARKNYIIVVDGEIYNEEEIKDQLREAQYPPIECIEELFVYAYLHWKKAFMEHLHGAYAFVIYHDQQLIAAKDPLGLSLLYYYDTPDCFAVTNSIDLLLKNARIQPTLDQHGILNLFAFGPSVPENETLLTHLYQVPMGCYLEKKDTLQLINYYQLPVYKHTDSIDETIDKVHSLLKNSILEQAQQAKASFLSGGLDSSIITAICAKASKQWNSYSLEYEGNKENFKENMYQVSLDDEYIQQMIQRYHTAHTTCTITQEELKDRLHDALLARGFPGMADVDSSLLWLCEQVADNESIVLSGECSDEIFGGYPWFYRDELKDLASFPWLRSTHERIALLHPSLQKLNFEEHIQSYYQNSISDIGYLSTDKKEDRLARKHTVLCLHWFMQNLVVRQLTMAKAAGITIRAPFANVDLLAYVYNIPWNMKFYQGQEKGILRKAFEKELPYDVCWRKKNPYPKTHNPEYAQLMQSVLQECYDDKTSPLHILFDDQKLRELIESKGASFTLPWYGQLMSGPQLLAYLYQIHCWIKEYHIHIEVPHLK